MFVERIRLHQYVAGTGRATVDYGTLLTDGAQLVVDTAERIDIGERIVALASGRVLNYDYLIHAVGSNTTAPESAYSIGEFEQARRLREALDALGPDVPVTVVGGGLTGIETASELAGQGRRTARCTGRQHRAQPHQRHRSGDTGPGVHRAAHQPGPMRGHYPARPARRHPDQRIPHRPAALIKEASAGAQCGRFAAKRPSLARTVGSKAATGRRRSGRGGGIDG